VQRELAEAFVDQVVTGYREDVRELAQLLPNMPENWLERFGL